MRTAELSTPTRRPRVWPRLFAALVSGAAFLPIGPPIDLAELHWVNFVPLLLALVPGAPWLNFRLGYLTGVVGSVSLYTWVVQALLVFADLPYPLAVAVLLVFALVAGLPYGLLAMAVHPLRQRIGAAWVVAVPTLWVAIEFLQPPIFPYYHGASQYVHPWIFQSAAVFGVYGISFLVFLVNATLAELWLGRPRPPWPLGLAVLGLWLANSGFGVWRYRAIEAALQDAPVLRVGIVQQGVAQVPHYEQRGKEVLERWLALTRQLIPDAPELVIWPEGATHLNPTRGQTRDQIGALAREGKFFILVGSGTAQPSPERPTAITQTNSAFLFDPYGIVHGQQDKMRLFPVSESLPLLLRWLQPYLPGELNYRAGEIPARFQAGAFEFTAPICYDAIFEREMRMLGVADFYAGITNDGWFAGTPTPYQHVRLAAVQAFQNGRTLVRVAYTGVSLVIEPHGFIPYQTEFQRETTAVVPVRVRAFDTPYQTSGRAFPILCVVLTGIGAISGAIGLLRRPSPPRPPAES